MALGGKPLGDASTLDADEVVATLASDARLGLTSAEAAARLRRDGRNELRSTPRVAGWRRLLAQFQDPLVYLLLAAIVVALAAWGVEGRGGWPIDATVIATIVLLNGVLGFVQEAKAQDAVAALAHMTVSNSTVLRDGQQRRVPSTDLVRGDILVLSEGDAIGADGRLVECASLRVQEASLTGESDAMQKNLTTLGEPAPLGDRLDMVFKGSTVAQGSGRAVVTATGMDTEMGSVAAMLEATAQPPTPLEKEVAHLGRMLGLAVIVIAVVVVAAILLVSQPRNAAGVVEVLLLGVALAVAAVPEGLPAILTVVLALGVQRMARQHAIVRNLSSVETLGCASVICTDKTGTLTRAEMTIERIVTASGSTHVTGAGYAPEGRVEHEGASLPAGPLHDEQVGVLSGGCLAGNASLRQTSTGAWEIQGDPTEAAFLVAERKLGPTAPHDKRYSRIAEVAFTSERKMMSVVVRDHDHDDDAVLVTKGAPDVLLQHCTRVQVGTQSLELDSARRAGILAEIDAMSDAALRTLSVAMRVLGPTEDPHAGAALERDLVFAGTVGMMDPPREEAMLAIHESRRAGIRVIMITGDHPRTAARIATDLGLADVGAQVLTGRDLDALDAAGLEAAARVTHVYARVAPIHKLRVVAALQAGGDIVAMTGDGVNDAPALKAADIGIAMGRTGTEVAKEAAKMVLADDNFASIVEAVREGRNIFANIRKFLRYLLSSNLGEVLTVFGGVVGAGVIGLAGPGDTMVLPLLATQILWLNLITDSWPALAMGVDPPTDDMMARRPRPRAERVIDARMWWGMCEIGVVVAAVALLTMDICLPGGLVEGTGSIAAARTAGFTVLVMAHLFNCFNARSATASAFRHLFVNPWLWGAIALSASLQIAVVHLPFLNVAFGTVPLTFSQWMLCLAMASCVLWYGELRKLAAQLLHRSGGPARSADLPGRHDKSTSIADSTAEM